jgi:hypothetical protein
MEDILTDKQRRYAANIVRGMESRQAAESAGYRKSYAKVIGHRLKQHPAVKHAIQTAHAELREKAMYDVEQAVQEIDKAVVFGYTQKNPMSVAKLLELKAKLYGLFIDRFQEVPVDLKGALEAAERRVLNITPLSSDGVVAGSVRWAPRIPGAPVAENPEAGPVDGESVRQVNKVGPENR